jgi:hypothetical protein
MSPRGRSNPAALGALSYPPGSTGVANHPEQLAVDADQNFADQSNPHTLS